MNTYNDDVDNFLDLMRLQYQVAEEETGEEPVSAASKESRTMHEEHCHATISETKIKLPMENNISDVRDGSVFF